MQNLKLLVLVSFLLSTSLLAQTQVRVRTNGIGVNAPLAEVLYIIGSDKITVRANGRSPENKLVSCIIIFPFTMKEYAHDVYKTLLAGQTNGSFSFNCTGNNPGNPNIAIVDISAENAQGNFSFETTGIR